MRARSSYNSSSFSQIKEAMPIHHFVILFSYIPTLPFPALARRVLHHPFFPLASSLPPAQPPSIPFPKYPSSTNQRPFFLSNPVSPTPPQAVSSYSSLPTFPANISSLISPHSHSSTTKLLGVIAFPILSLTLVSFVLFLIIFFYRRRRPDNIEDGSDSDMLFPPNSAASDSRKPSANSGSVSSEFLYLGTLVNSRGQAEEGSRTAIPVPTSSLGQYLGSPELRPLPPLARHVRRMNGDDGFSSEEFYSPSGSPGQKRIHDFRYDSSLKLNFSAAPLLEKRGSTVSTLSTPSYPSSNAASSPSPSSPTVSCPHIDSSLGRANTKLPRIAVFTPLPPPSPPRTPAAQLRPMTPSPQKRKPPSPSPTYSPPKKVSDSLPIQNLWSPRIFGKVPSIVTPQPPPPPPRASYYENQFIKFPAQQTDSLAFATVTSESSVSMERSEETAKPKLKPLHWDKVKASSDRAMVWDQMKSSSFQLNEEMIDTLFVYDTKNTVHEGGMKPTPAVILENRVLDPKRSQNIAILLRALNLTKEEVCEALLEGNTDALGNELLETLLRMAPNKEEELKLRGYKDNSPFKLGPAEIFLKAVVEIPFAFKRVEAMLYIANFDAEINYLLKSFETLETACEELRTSRLFLKLLEAVLMTGNCINVGTNRGGAQAFRLDTLLKLVDVKGTDGKTTLLHFVVQEIVRAEGFCGSATEAHLNNFEDDLEYQKFSLQIVSALRSELINVKNSAGMDSDVLTSYALKLTRGIGKVREVVRRNEVVSPAESSHNKLFHNSMICFLKKAEVQIAKLHAQESVTLSLVKEITEYFHGKSVKEEAHPFRIFMIVRDFLNILDQVCKEIGRINDRTCTSSAHQFVAQAGQITPQVSPKLHALSSRSSEDKNTS